MYLPSFSKQQLTCILISVQAKAFVADPSAFAALAPVVEKTEEKAAAKEPEPEADESDDDMGFGLFD